MHHGVPASPGGSVFIVPAPLLDTHGGRDKQRRPRAPRKPQPSFLDEPGPRNYLTKGGQRSIEAKLEAMQVASLQELRSANMTLATELMKARGQADALCAEQASMKPRLEEALAARAELEALSATRMREIQKRFKQQHDARVKAEGDAERERGAARAAEALLARCQDELSEARSVAGSLQASVAADSALVAELRSRLSSAEERLESERAGRAEASGRVMQLEAQMRAATEKAASAAAAGAEASSREHSASARAATAEDKRADLASKLASEKEALAQARADATRANRDLSELQAAMSVLSATATEDKAEVERLRRQVEGSSRREDAAVAESASAREQLLSQGAELAGLRATTEAASRTEAEQREELRRTVDRIKHEAAVAAQESERQTDALESDLHSAKAVAEAAEAKATSLHEQIDKLAFQTCNYSGVFAQNESLQARLDGAENSLRHKESVLAEAMASHASQLEMWRAEATEVAQAAAKWKQRSLLLQAQLDTKEAELERVAAEAGRAAAADCDAVRTRDALRVAEARASSSQEEAQRLRSQLQSALSAQQLNTRDVEGAKRALLEREAALDRAVLQLQEEGGRVNSLRQQVADLTAQHVKELDSKSRLVADLTLQLQRQERGRSAAQAEAASLREHLSAVERELRVAQGALSKVQDDGLRGSGAYSAAAAALLQAERRARQYDAGPQQQYNQPVQQHNPPSQQYSQPGQAYGACTPASHPQQQYAAVAQAPCDQLRPPAAQQQQQQAPRDQIRPPAAQRQQTQLPQQQQQQAPRDQLQPPAAQQQQMQLSQQQQVQLPQQQQQVPRDQMRPPSAQQQMQLPQQQVPRDLQQQQQQPQMQWEQPTTQWEQQPQQLRQQPQQQQQQQAPRDQQQPTLQQQPIAQWEQQPQQLGQQPQQQWQPQQQGAPPPTQHAPPYQQQQATPHQKQQATPHQQQQATPHQHQLQQPVSVQASTRSLARGTAAAEAVALTAHVHIPMKQQQQQQGMAWSGVRGAAGAVAVGDLPGGDTTSLERLEALLRQPAGIL
ncbi:hypothetical protein FOA52_015021 [Chlamydomonas sp. UWO 241]|nr:hypothetical protein FOA52_015021 [Chlamydomonas sp. UWO 241]